MIFSPHKCRLLPPLIAAILFQLLWPLAGSGPAFREAGFNVTDNCLNNFYKILISTSNFETHNSMVSVHDLYLIYSI